MFVRCRSAERFAFDHKLPRARLSNTLGTPMLEFSMCIAFFWEQATNSTTRIDSDPPNYRKVEELDKGERWPSLNIRRGTDSKERVKTNPQGVVCRSYRAHLEEWIQGQYPS